MKLLVDAHVFDGKYQGTRTYIKGLYAALIKQCPNWTFYLVARDIDNLKNEFGNYQHISYIKLKNKNKFYRLFFELPAIVKTHNIDYAHFQYISPLFKNCRHIVTTHDILFEEKEFKKFFPIKYRLVNGLFFRISAKRADILFTVSDYSRSCISEHYNIPLENIHLTYNGVDKDFFRQKEQFELERKLKDMKFILYVSRIEPRKNHLTLVKAFLESGIYKKGYKLVFIGSNDIEDPFLEVYLDKNKVELEDNVLWLNNISYEQIKIYYANCSLFVFPSFAEGFGIPVLEAMVHEKKILVADSTAMKDFNLPYELTFNPYDITELKQKMISMLDNNRDDFLVLYKKLLKKYSWDNSANQMIQTLTANIKK